MLIVRKQLDDFQGDALTKHFQIERLERFDAYKQFLGTEFIYYFECDSGHKNGDEVHAINGYGLIYIYNVHTRKLVTILHPRPAQLTRYFKQLHLKVPLVISTLARICHERNEKFNYNNA